MSNRGNAIANSDEKIYTRDCLYVVAEGYSQIHAVEAILQGYNKLWATLHRQFFYDRNCELPIWENPFEIARNLPFKSQRDFITLCMDTGYNPFEEPFPFEKFPKRIQKISDFIRENFEYKNFFTANGKKIYVTYNRLGEEEKTELYFSECDYIITFSYDHVVICAKTPEELFVPDGFTRTAKGTKAYGNVQNARKWCEEEHIRRIMG